MSGHHKEFEALDQASLGRRVVEMLWHTAKSRCCVAAELGVPVEQIPGLVRIGLEAKGLPVEEIAPLLLEGRLREATTVAVRARRGNRTREGVTCST